jgi:serine/threonine-protein kinase RsbW
MPDQKEELVYTDPAHIVRLNVPATHKFLNVVGACLIAVLERVERLPEKQTLAYNVELAVHETCANIVEHAYPEGIIGRIDVIVSLIEHPRRLVVDLHDSGRTFNIDEVKPLDLSVPQPRGYGLFLMHELLDEVSYRPQPGNNRWRLVKKL